ncbi:MAG TPA: ZIP family metal transporter [Candidatus Acidoferrales bacterium]|nr:ZIP family metal transporter [Candidatus Acidoferrales bacterium]
MSPLQTALLGAIAGGTIFLGLPIARLRGLDKRVQGLLNAIATGILVFLLWDILSHAAQPVEAGLAGLRKGDPDGFWILAGVFAGGIAVGLLALVYFNGSVLRRLRRGHDHASPRGLAMMIATGLGLHNLSEGLAIGQSAHIGAIAFAGVLVIGFALHNVTEGFGIAAPLATDTNPAPWSFLATAGLIGGGPTFVGTLLGYLASSTYVYVLFLALAAGAILYVLNELFALGKRLNTPAAMGWGLLAGFTAAFGTDLILSYVAG